MQVLNPLNYRGSHIANCFCFNSYQKHEIKQMGSSAIFFFVSIYNRDQCLNKTICPPPPCEQILFFRRGPHFIFFLSREYEQIAIKVVFFCNNNFMECVVKKRALTENLRHGLRHPRVWNINIYVSLLLLQTR